MSIVENREKKSYEERRESGNNQKLHICFHLLLLSFSKGATRLALLLFLQSQCSCVKLHVFSMSILVNLIRILAGEAHHTG